jgi:hypothetical protein
MLFGVTIAHKRRPIHAPHTILLDQMSNYLHSKTMYSLFSLFLAFRLFQEHFICIYRLSTMYRFAVVTKPPRKYWSQTYTTIIKFSPVLYFLFPFTWLAKLKRKWVWFLCSLTPWPKYKSWKYILCSFNHYPFNSTLSGTNFSAISRFPNISAYIFPLL